jgi:hypothetical protein
MVAVAPQMLSAHHSTPWALWFVLSVSLLPSGPGGKVADKSGQALVLLLPSCASDSSA